MLWLALGLAEAKVEAGGTSKNQQSKNTMAPWISAKLMNAD